MWIIKITFVLLLAQNLKLTHGKALNSFFQLACLVRSRIKPLDRKVKVDHEVRTPLHATRK